MKQKDWPQAAGETAELIRNFDWSQTSLGEISNWPQYVRTPIDLALRSPVPIAMLWGADGVMIYNDAYAVFAGARHPQLLGSRILEGWPEIADFNRRVMEVGLSGNTLSFQDQNLTLYRNGLPESVWMDLDYSPIVNDEGRPAGVLAIVVETTNRVQTESRLRLASERIQLALDAGAIIGTWLWDVPNDRFTADERFARTVSIDPEKAQQGMPLNAVVQSIHPEDRRAVRGLVVQALKTGGAYRAEYRVLQPDGAIRWVEANGFCQLDWTGKPLRFPGVLIDVTERKEYEEHLVFIMRELTHRSKNLLAVIQSIARQTVRTSDKLEQFEARFVGRLQALARSHDTLVSQNWRGAILSELVRLQLAPFIEDERRVIWKGPLVTLNAEATQNLGLAFHELATNASKYGALNGSEGKVHVTWGFKPQSDGSRMLEIIWREEGGPTVGQPQRDGFGTKVIELMISSALKGTARSAFEPDGLVWTFEIPAAFIVKDGI
jgi:two-component sensor histidine kinase